jgi:hypothetical protein
MACFRSLVDLQAAINHDIAEHNADPKRFTWTKPADQCASLPLAMG